MPTRGPAKDGGLSGVGTAAHITAAAPNGPRYDPNLTREQRRSYENGIWLCAIHGREVDSDDSRYSKEELLEWKAAAENYAHQRLGRLQPREEDATKMLLMATTGSGGSFMPQALSRFHKAFEGALVEMDPRFRITTQYSEKGPVYRINAVQPATVRIEIRGNFKHEEIDSKFSDLIEHGLPLELTDAQISLPDAPSLNNLIGRSEAGKFEVTQIPRPAEIRLRIASPEGRNSCSLSPIPAEFYSGTKSWRLKASAFHGLLDIEVIYQLGEGPGNLIVTPRLERWDGLDVFSLPEYDDIYELFIKLAFGWSLGVRLRIDGKDVMYEAMIACASDPTIRWSAAVLKYTEAARSIAKHTKSNIQVRLAAFRFDQTADEVMRTADAVELSSKPPSGFHADIVLNGNFGLQPDPDGIFRIPAVRLWVPAGAVTVFGQPINTPSCGYYFSDMEIRRTGEQSPDGFDIATLSGTKATTRVIVPDEPEQAPDLDRLQ